MFNLIILMAVLFGTTNAFASKGKLETVTLEGPRVQDFGRAEGKAFVCAKAQVFNDYSLFYSPDLNIPQITIRAANSDIEEAIQELSSDSPDEVLCASGSYTEMSGLTHSLEIVLSSLGVVDREELTNDLTYAMKDCITANIKREHSAGPNVNVLESDNYGLQVMCLGDEAKSLFSVASNEVKYKDTPHTDSGTVQRVFEKERREFFCYFDPQDKRDDLPACFFRLSISLSASN